MSGHHYLKISYLFKNLLRYCISFKNLHQFLRYPYAYRNQVFLDFSKYLRSCKEFSKSQRLFFQVLPHNISTKSQVHPMMSSYLELVNMWYFLKKRADLCVLINLKFKNVAMSLWASFCIMKKREIQKQR